MSLLEATYRHSPIAIQNWLITLYGLKLRRLRLGGAYERYRDELDKSQWLSSEALDRLQTQSLQNLLRHAFATVPYYRALAQSRGLSAETITPQTLHRHLPVLEKADVKSAPERFLSDANSPRHLATIHTSGTTGTPLTIRCSKESIRKNYAFFSRFLRWAGVDIGLRNATFAGRIVVPPLQARPPYWRSNRAFHSTLFSSYHLSSETLPAYVEALSALQPLYIDAYPSAIYTVARFVNATKFPHRVRPRAIVTSSETLLEHQREEIETAFGCKVFDQFGNAEMAAFISQCDHGSYHIHSEYGIVEIVDPDGTPLPPGSVGQMVCTGFLNDAMPLVRYRIGDSARLTLKTCGCGRRFPVVEALEGRSDDILIGSNGQAVGRLDPLFKGLTGVSETQIVQDRLGAVRALVVPAPNYGPETALVLTARLKERLGREMDVTIEEVPSIPRTRSGKFRAVINNIHKS